MNVFELVASLKLDSKEFEKSLGGAGTKMKSFASGAGKVMLGVGKAVATGVMAAGAAVGAIAVQATKAYSEFEQLKGGIETLFGAQGMSLQEYAESMGKPVSEVASKFKELSQAQEIAMQNAADAYKTAGMSANEYMSTITGFAASLKQSTANEVEAAKVANMAVIDMADNANKMGTSMESIQNAYQGFAKQNYTMLDNLKLGYGGTKEEMERLLADAEKLTGIHYDINELDDVYSAIHVIQEDIGITGTTAKEAMSTIQGSLSMTKAAWQNLLIGIASGEGDLNTLIDNLVESFTAFGGNVIPVFERSLSGIGKAVASLAPIIGAELPKLIADVLPSMLEAGQGLIDGLLQGLQTAVGSGGMVKAAVDAVMSLVEFIVQNLPLIIDVGLDILLALIDGIIDALPELIAMLPEIISTITATLIDHIPEIIEAGFQLVIALIKGIVEYAANLPAAWNKEIEAFKSAVAETWESIKEKAVAVWNAITDAAAEIWQSIKDAIITPIEDAYNSVASVVQSIFDKVSGAFNQIRSTVSSIWNSIKSAITTPLETAKNTVKSIIDRIKGFFNFKIKWPNIPLPHFSITPSGWKIGDLLKGKIPKLGIEWYDKGGIFDRPTVIGVGEKRPEFVGALDDLRKIVREESRPNESVININVYGAQGQSEKAIAEEVMRVMRREARRKAAFA